MCNGNCVHVRAGANGDGSDWANARGQLPATLERGSTYLVAGGSYPAYTFDDPASGQQLITIKKATALDHGTDTGWQASYGTEKAVFGPLSVTRPYFVIDGGPGRGLIARTSTGTSAAVSIRTNDVTLRRVEVDGAFKVDSKGEHLSGSCNALTVRDGTNVNIEQCEVHDAADDGIVINTCTNCAVRDSHIHHLHGCGTDASCVGACFNGHSDGFELYAMKDGVIEGNFVHHVKQTSALFFPQPGGTENLTIRNNIFYAADTGLIAYLQRAKGLYVYHNVFWGKRKGNYGGLAIGPDLSDLYLYNNIILSINLSHAGTVYDASKYRGDYNLLGVDIGQFPKGANDIIASDPMFTAIPDMNGDMVANPTVPGFLPKPGSPAINKGWVGNSTHVMPILDMLGNPRVGVPDIGPLECP